MRRSTLLLAVVSLGLVFTAPVMSQSDDEALKSDWIELVKGYKGDTMGAEIREIEEEGADGTRKITLAIPKTAIKHPDEIEEVVVVGRKPEEPEPLFNLRLEWLDDYDNDNYGLVIHLGKDSNWPIRLYMSSESGYMR
jgi:hypothetical protein